MMERRDKPFLSAISACDKDETDEKCDREAGNNSPHSIIILSFTRGSYSFFHHDHHLMRTPSLYSQDDPITAAMKPPSSETEAERAARLVAEAEAKRVSERIDEDLREERERLKKRKGDVKVRLSILQRVYTHLASSYCSWDKPRAANRLCRNNSSLCTSRTR